MNRNLLVALAVIVVVVLAGWFVVKSRSEKNETTEEGSKQVVASPATSSSTDQTSTGSALTGDVQEIMVSGSNFKFDPNTITVKVNKPVRITFKDIQGFHNFTIDSLNVQTKTIQSNQEDVVEFTPTKTGAFQFYCSVANHRQMGMQGTLVVQ